MVKALRWCTNGYGLNPPSSSVKCAIPVAFIYVGKTVLVTGILHWEVVFFEQCAKQILDKVDVPELWIRGHRDTKSVISDGND